MYTYSDEHKKYLKKIKKEKRIVLFFQILIITSLIIIWQMIVNLGLINTFLSSSPIKVINTTVSLLKDNTLFHHIWITTYETLLSFAIASLLGLVIGAILWWNKILAKIIDPYLTVLNSLPKVALGPLIIIWVGASTNSIIFMALLITSFVSIINIYTAFSNTDENYITLLKSFNASKMQIFFKVVLPSNYYNIVNTLKLNISMSLIGVIMGELLVSKSGLGYLIMYGSQVFNIDLVITSVFILGILSLVMYLIISKLNSIGNK